MFSKYVAQAKVSAFLTDFQTSTCINAMPNSHCKYSQINLFSTIERATGRFNSKSRHFQDVKRPQMYSVYILSMLEMSFLLRR